MSEIILICAATVREMNACIKSMDQAFEGLPTHEGIAWARSFSSHNREYILAITGIGMPLTIARLLPLAAGCSPSAIINLGIAGAYLGSGLGLGDLVVGESECFGDMGMETPSIEVFLPLANMPWADEVYRQALPLSLVPWNLSGPKSIRVGRGCTVNSCTGREETGVLRRKLFNADFESMEGAGVALTARMLGLAASEVRAISNFASTRDMRPEYVDLALNNLGGFMESWLGRAG
jgi:futalosine hydrolase